MAAIHPADTARIEDHEGGISDAALAGYIAKYATKGTSTSQAADRPIRSERDIDVLTVAPHHKTMIRTAWELGGLPGLGFVRHWAHMLTHAAAGRAISARSPLVEGLFRDAEVPERFRAIANYRDYDGVTRPVERVGKSEAKAKARLKEALRDRARRSGGEEITARAKLSAVADLWLRDVDESNKATTTKQTYRESWERDLAKAVGALQGA